MFTVEFSSNGKRYNVEAERENFSEARAIFEGIALEGKQRVRLKDDDGAVIDRRKPEDTVAVDSGEQDHVTLSEAVAEESGDDMETESETVTEESAEETESDSETPERATLEIPDRTNTLLAHGPVLNLRPIDTAEAWNAAIDVVNYPVKVMPAFGQNSEGEMVRADGVTNTGRETEFYFVFTDRERTGELNAVAAMTGRFKPINTAEVYCDLRDALEEMKENAEPVSVYVSGDGGRHALTIETDRKGLNGKVILQMNVYTSVDGTSCHTMNLSVKDKKTGTVISGLGAGSYTLSAKHTVNAAEESVYFGPALTGIIQSWDDEIIPVLEFLNDSEFDKNMSVEVAKQFAKDSGLADRHIKKLMEETRIGYANMSGYELIREVCAYVEANGKSPEFIERTREKMEKGVNRMLDRIHNGQTFSTAAAPRK